MTATVAIVPEKSHTQTVARIGWALLILATLYVCYFSHLGAIGFVGPDEPRYAWVAREMAETGDWITPRLYGKPWFEKPPLYYWGAALCFKLFGVSEATARLPSAICALLATLALAWLAWRLYGGETARWLLLLLPTTVGMIGFSHAAATDMPFSAMLTIAMVFAAVRLRLVQPDAAVAPNSSASSNSFTSFISSSSLAAILFGFFIGLAVLAKGPAAIILCGGAMFFWALFTKRWRDALRLFHPAGISAFCVTALPWYVLCARRNPDFLRIFIIEHNFKRYLTPEFQHIQPFWYYGPVVLAALLPWTAVFLWACVRFVLHLWQIRSLSDTTIFQIAWPVFCIAFFSVSQSKLPGYVLPAIPPLGLILARFCTSAPTARRSLSFTLLATGLALLGFVVTLQGSGFALLKNLVAFAPVIALSGFAFALANIFLGTGFLVVRISRQLALWAAVCPLILLLALANSNWSRVPLFIISPRYLADEIQADHIPTKKLRMSRINRSTHYGLNFYLRTDLTEWYRGDTSHEVYVLIRNRFWPTCGQEPKEMNCSDLWTERERIDQFGMLHLTPKTSAADTAGRETQ